jgi:outer membrane protein
MKMPRCLIIFLLLLGVGIFCSSGSHAETLELKLEQAVSLALTHNPRIEIARQQCLQSRGVLTQAWSGYLPQLDVAGGYRRQHIQDLQPLDEDNVGYGSVRLSQLIYDFGKTTGAIDAGRFSLEASRANMYQLYQDVVFAVKQAFYEVLAKKRLIQVAELAIGIYEKHLYRAEKYFQAGVRAKIDVTNARLQLSNARLDLIQAEANLKVEQKNLENVLGLRPNEGDYLLLSGEGPLEKMAAGKPAMSFSLDLLQAAAAQHRPEMKQVRFLVQSAEANVSRAKSGYFPRLDAGAVYDDFETDLAGLQDQWQVGVGLSWQLFSGLRTRGEVTESRAKFRELQAALHDLELSITREVAESFLRADENRAAVDIAAEALDLARENLDQAEGRYKAGLNDMIEFNDAQLRYTDAQVRLVTTYYNYLVALAGIERATGTTAGLQYVSGNDSSPCQVRLNTQASQQ